MLSQRHTVTKPQISKKCTKSNGVLSVFSALLWLAFILYRLNFICTPAQTKACVFASRADRQTLQIYHQVVFYGLIIVLASAPKSNICWALTKRSQLKHFFTN